MICAFSEPARTVGCATMIPQNCICLKLSSVKKNWRFPVKGIFPSHENLSCWEIRSQKNWRLQNFICSPEKLSARENLCGKNRWFETSRNFSCPQQKIVGMKNIAGYYKNWAMGDFRLTRRRYSEIPASTVICAGAMAVFPQLLRGNQHRALKKIEPDGKCMYKSDFWRVFVPYSVHIYVRWIKKIPRMKKFLAFDLSAISSRYDWHPKLK